MGGMFMIRKIDIKRFGSFYNFNWGESVREGDNVLEFKRLNILYGRNYSGKTTLSRIIRSLEKGKLPDKYKDPSFVITTSDGPIDQTKIASHNLNVRVYNKDFVDDHLSFLKDNNGNIIPFAIVGSENKSIQQEIKKIELILGSIEDQTGLRHKYAVRQVELKKQEDSLRLEERTLQRKLSKKASDMKRNTLYQDPNYNRTKLEADINTVRREAIEVLSEDEKQELQSLLGQKALPDIQKTLRFSPSAKSLYETAQKLLEKRIAPTRPIRDLLDDALLQAWVKEGIRHHRGKRTTCGFCGQALPADLWEKLDAHFSKESQELSESLARHIAAIDAEIARARTISTLREEDFYSTNRRRFRELSKGLEREIDRYVAELEEIKAALKARQDDIFTPGSPPSLSDNTPEIAKLIASINTLIAENNEKTRSLASDQEEARRALRLSEVAQFSKDSGLLEDEKRIAELKQQVNDAKKDVQALIAKIEALERKVQNLRAQITDERKGAEKVNEYLNHFFGHGRLRLVAEEDPKSSDFNFRIFRGKDPAYNLSEGECSLVAFCYFVAKLEDAETKGKDLIIYIDDPISSLDSNHIFFVYSLIESVLKPEGSHRYRQLFISTHNLDFLKYLRRLSRPKDKETAYFLVELQGDRSTLSPMPRYLREYITEFNYLFEQIYKCRNPDYAKEHYETFYSFGNNLRKFLEAYLFYKYPDCSGLKNKLLKFFGNDNASASLMKKLVDEYSHLAETIDRGMRPLDVPEIPRLANFVLDTLYKKDPDQYNALLESIGEPPRNQVIDNVAATVERSNPAST